MQRRFLRRYDGKKQGWLRQAKELVVFVIAAFLIFRFVIGISFVKGDSMLSTLQSGEIVVYTRIVPSYEQGDIVSVRMPSGAYYIKRVVAVEGDMVEVRDGGVYLNGELLEEPYVSGTTEPQTDGIRYPYELTEGMIFVMGDNREVSVDSRTFGPVYRRQIKGKVLFSFVLPWG